MLDEHTLLLEYFLGGERSYVWAISSNSTTSYQLPAREVIEAAARGYYDLLSTGKSGRDVKRAARALSDIVLAPAAERLRDKRLAVIADGALHSVPFAALPEPRPDATETGEQPLIVNHEVVSLPSASTLAGLRNEARARVPQEKLVADAEIARRRTSGRQRRGVLSRVAGRQRCEPGSGVAPGADRDVA